MEENVNPQPLNQKEKPKHFKFDSEEDYNCEKLS